jgi:site-specific DNA-methyltransferase (adenine-specific)
MEIEVLFLFSEKIEKAFGLMEQSIQLLQRSLDTSFLDAYIENGENIIDAYQVRVLDGVPDEQTVQQLKTIYQQLQAIELDSEEIRRLSQLILLKGNKAEPLQANHQLTPDSIGFLFVFLIEQLYNTKQSLKVLDIATGMGNLLLTVLLNLKLANFNVQGFGVDIDDTLLAVSATNNEWTQASIQLFHQDGLQDLLIDPVDVTISDLPIGFYPNDEKAAGFDSAAEDGHSYAHHLLMEQAMKYVKPDGYGLFLIPTNILETEQSSFFKNWLQKNVYLQGMIQLPDELFKSVQSRKSILIVQNKGVQSEQAKEVLLAKLGSLKDPAKVTQFFQQFETWKSSNLK